MLASLKIDARILHLIDRKPRDIPEHIRVLVNFNKSELPLCKAIGNLEERCPLNEWQWNQYHV